MDCEFSAKGKGVKELGGAKYIKACQNAPAYSFSDPLSRFRREIEIEDEVLNAQVVVQAPSFAQVFINGKNITEDIFISALSDYRKILWYNTYDVTTLLKKGKNAVAVICGNGFFNESLPTAWHFENAEWKDAPQFLLSLFINGKIALVSDSEWKVDRENMHVTYSHLRSGENVDMRKFDESWKEVGYDDGAWKNAIERDYPFDAKLKPTLCPPVREKQRVLAKKISKTDSGYLVDFGFNMSGYAEIVLKESRGKEITLSFCEEVTSKGEAKHLGNDSDYFYPACKQYHQCKIIASGNRDVFKPSFAYFGFRYVIIEGLENELKSEDIRAIFIHQDVKRKASFECGNEIINYIYNAGILSCYSNMFWSMTDCPTREKLGWMNDAQATCEHAFINFDMRDFYEKWFEDIKAQMREDGALTGVVPSPDWGYNWGPVCDCMLYELPYRFYQYTGEKDMLVGGIEHFDRYIAYLESALQTGYQFILGDWLGCGNSLAVPKKFVWDFYLIKAYTITVLAYNLAGRDCSNLVEKLNSARKEFIKAYIQSDGKCVIDDQTALSIVITNGLYTNKDAVCAQLISLVENSGNELRSGMVGVQYIYDALTISKRADLAVKMITESSPGYKNWYENGATTLWEIWDGAEKNSHNHHMFSAVIGWFFKSLLGVVVDVKNPAFKSVEFAPCFVKAIKFAKGEIEVEQGTIQIEWKYENGEFIYIVNLPKGIEATFKHEKLSEGKNIFVIKE